jgi:predicted RNase H-like HicB family nuclease
MPHRIRVVIYLDGDQWTALALDAEVASFGATPEEAHAAIQEALELYFEDDEDDDSVEVVLSPRDGRATHD